MLAAYVVIILVVWVDGLAICVGRLELCLFALCLLTCAWFC